MNKWKAFEINTISSQSINFPKSLLGLKNVPQKLFYRGCWDNGLFEKSIAVVGSRRMTGYGKETVEMFVSEFVNQKITVISGFMYGVDTEAHKKSLEYGGKTIAVLGSGLNCLYPSENEKLYCDIIEKGGLIISEYEPDFKPTLWSFPQRNRIVAALAELGVLVIEAGIKSGSLITAKLGSDLGKKVFAVPGQINSKLSQGTNWLIKNNLARLTENAGDILDIDISKYIQSDLFSNDLDDSERMILELLECESLSIDEIALKSGLSISSISILVTNMILKNIIAEEGEKLKLKKKF